MNKLQEIQKKVQIERYLQFIATSENPPKCDKCKKLIKFARVGSSAISYSCPCGKFAEVVEGI